MSLEQKLKTLEESKKKLEEAMHMVFEAGGLSDEVSMFKSNRYFGLRQDIKNEMDALDKECSTMRIKGGEEE